ncbi:MAG: glycine-rich domain-containing protein-like [Cyanobacteria bacterium J06597_16]
MVSSFRFSGSVHSNISRQAVSMQQTLSKTHNDFLNRLSKVDFGPIAYKLMNPEEGEGWTIERATQAIEQYRRFLFLVNQYPERKIVPSREIDQVWHTHILDTAKYRQDCDLIFGEFMDHWPYFGMKDAEEEKELHLSFSDTQSLMKIHFEKSF